jgi:hypothetical protein
MFKNCNTFSPKEGIRFRRLAITLYKITGYSITPPMIGILALEVLFPKARIGMGM